MWYAYLSYHFLLLYDLFITEGKYPYTDELNSSVYFDFRATPRQK